MRENNTFVFANGKEITYRSYESRGFAAAIAVAVQRIFSSLDERAIADITTSSMLELMQAHSTTVSLKTGDDFYTESCCYIGAIIESEKGHRVPKESVTTIIDTTHRPVQWLMGGENHTTEWLAFPNFIGVPILNDEQQVIGTLVASFTDESIASENYIFAAEIIAGAYYQALKNARSYQHSLETGQVLEQERIAQELHDSAAQNVFSMGMKTRRLLERSDLSEQLREELAELMEIVMATKQGLRNAVFSGAEQKIVSNSIAELIEHEAQAHRAVDGIKIVTTIESPVEPSEEISAVIKVFVREALTNIQKHAHATTATVSYFVNDGKIYLSVNDDGIGIQRAAHGANDDGLHFGLENLRRLVEKVGGTFSIGCMEDDEGTSVLARIPLRKGHPNE